MPLRITSRRLMAAASLLSLLTISSALASQYIGGLQPCDLCLQQRGPYYAGLPLMAIAVLAWPWLPRIGRALSSLVIGLLFLYGTYLAVYHSGVEWGFWPGPTSCSGIGGEIDFSDMMNMKPVVRCDAVQFRFMGLSLAGLNAIVSMIVLGLVIAAGAWKDKASN